MHLSDFFAPEAISIGLRGGSQGRDPRRSSSACCGWTLRANDALLRMLQRRETLGSTGVGRGIAIPHCRSTVVSRLRLAYGHHRDGHRVPGHRRPPGVRFLPDRGSHHSRSPTSIFRSSENRAHSPRSPTSRTGWRPSHRLTTSCGCWGRRECSPCAGGSRRFPCSPFSRRRSPPNPRDRLHARPLPRLARDRGRHHRPQVPAPHPRPSRRRRRRHRAPLGLRGSPTRRPRRGP